MAMQAAGVLGSKGALLLAGAAAGTYVIGGKQILDLINDLTKVLVKHLKEKDKKEDGGEGSSTDSTAAALSAQVRWLTAELRNIASQRNQVTVVHAGGERRGVTMVSIVVPVAVVGAGYGFLRWRGWNLGDFMYVTRMSMQNAVASVSSQMENVSSAISSTRKYLSGRIDTVSKGLDESMQIQEFIRADVSEIRSTVDQVGRDVSLMHGVVYSLEDKIETIKEKQDIANRGIVLLCRAVMGIHSQSTSHDLVEGLHAYSSAPALPKATTPRTLSFHASTSSSGLKELGCIQLELEKEPTRVPAMVTMSRSFGGSSSLNSTSTSFGVAAAAAAAAATVPSPSSQTSFYRSRA